MQFEEKDVMNLVVLTRADYEEMVKIKTKFAFLRDLYEADSYVPEDMVRVIVGCKKKEGKKL